MADASPPNMDSEIAALYKSRLPDYPYQLLVEQAIDHSPPWNLGSLDHCFIPPTRMQPNLMFMFRNGDDLARAVQVFTRYSYHRMLIVVTKV